MRARFLVLPATLTLVSCGADWDLELTDQELNLAPFTAKAIKICDAKKIAEVTDQATKNNETVEIDCSLYLEPTDVVTKQLILAGSAASGITIDCKGAIIDHRKGGVGNINNGKDSILIKSIKTGGTCPSYTFDRPTDITIKRCKIFGAVRVMGMSKNGEGDANDGTRQVIKCSSHYHGHTARARKAAPTRITFDDIVITGERRTPLYLAPGVTHTKLIYSELNGKAVAAAVYLDAESAFNTLRNNYIHTKRFKKNWYTPKRELISVDGSSYNEIINNRFSALDSGGIYLYRNCGLKGVVRHARPYGNVIVNNIFYYKSYSGLSPAVYLGSKEGLIKDTLNPHCNDDDGYPFGSSQDNADFVRYTVVMQNQLYKRPFNHPSYPYLTHAPLWILIRESGGKNKPNYVDHNEIVTSGVQRKAGCYVKDGYLTNFILHGETIDVFKHHKGDPECRIYKYKCNDGKRQTLSNNTSSCSMKTVLRGCKVTGNNSGCQVSAHCPSGKRVIAARAACNLEWGSVSSSQLAQVPIDRVRVVKASDNPAVGLCRVHNTTLQKSTKKIKGLPAGSSLTLGCKEHDKNGGDCHVSARLYCQ